MTLDELKAEIAAGDIDTVLLALTDMQGRLQGKRLTAPWFLQSVVGHGAEGCNYLLAVDVDMNTVGGYAMSSWERGYGDFVFKPDLDTLCRTTWLEGTALCLADVEWEDGSPVVASPRQVLRAQLARLAERGWEAHAGTELEFMVFDDSYEQAWDNAYRGLTPANRYNVDYSMLGTARVEPLLRRIRNAMMDAGMVVEDSKGECNFGQHEINFLFADALRAADQHVDLQERRQGDGRPGRQGDHLHGQVQRARGQLVPHPPVAARHRRVDRLRRGGGAVRPLPGRHARGPARADALPGPEHQLLQALRRALLRARPRWRGATTTARARCAWSATAPAGGSSAASRAPTSTPTSRSAP